MQEVEKYIKDSEKYMDLIVNFSKDFGPKILGAIAVIWIGLKIINFVNKMVEKSMKKAKWDPMLESFLSSIISVVLKILVFISAAGILGVETSSFVAMLAAAGLAVGMSLSGTLQNFAGGVMILIFKPYRLGDYIETGSYKGFVKQISIFNTIILSIDRKTIIIPNSEISNGSMVNYTTEQIRGIDFDIGIGYSDNIQLAKDTLQALAKEDERILQHEGVTVVVKELGDSAVVLLFRFFVAGSDYWSTRWNMLEKIKLTFDEKGISFPFPQRDVHTYHHNEQ